MPTTYDNVPGVQIKEVLLSPPPLVGVSTSIAAFVGVAPKADRFVNTPRLVTSTDQFITDYTEPASTSTELSRAVLGFFANGGTQCWVVNTQNATDSDIITGLQLLEPIDEITILAAPGRTSSAVYDELKGQAERTGDRFAVLDPPAKQNNLADLKTVQATTGTGVRPSDSPYAAFYYPRILVRSKQLEGDPAPAAGAATTVAVSPAGHIAGVYARVDSQKGVHKAPANEKLIGALGTEHRLIDAQQNALNLEGVNILREFSDGIIVWGARTLQRTGDTSYRYINVRRLVNYIEETLQEGLRWAVFEPNTLPLRKQITRAVRAFLDGVWRDGGLFGATADEAYYVRFPDPYNTDAERAAGRLVMEIGLRVSYPAEFIIIRIGLLTQPANAA
jgi:phage tail sheath protein FI